MTQPTLGDWLRDKGCERVFRDTPEGWRGAFDAAAYGILLAKSEVSSDEAIAVVGLPPNHLNAVGAAMRSFATRNKLTIRRYKKSRRTERHSGRIAVWAYS